MIQYSLCDVAMSCELNNLCDLTKYKFLKLPEDDKKVSKHVGVNIT